MYFGGHNFWEGLFETVNIMFIKSLFAHQIVGHSNVLMTTIVPKKVSKEKYDDLVDKEQKLKQFLLIYDVAIDFFHIRGRTLIGLFNASQEILRLTSKYEDRFIWAANYFNCFIGVLIKKQSPKTRLHFDMRGLVPEEELHYSYSNILFRFLKFLVLRWMERVNIKNADSVSVVSRRFKKLIVTKYQLSPRTIEIIPCFFNYEQFYLDKESREKYRRQYQIEDHQKLVLFSGMLQKWQVPDLLFSFIKEIQTQDKEREFRFMMLTFDQDKAHHLMAKYDIRDMIIHAAHEKVLNGFYNAADIGIALRSADIVSFVSSPVKIPEYLATGNCLILLGLIGDFGLDLRNKKYVLIKKDKTELLSTSIEEIKRLHKPNVTDLQEIQERYGIQSYMEVIKKIINKKNAY